MTKKTRGTAFAALCAPALLLLACSRDGDVARLERTDDRDLKQATSEATINVDQASKSLSQVRCAREQRCENIGADKKWATLDDCRRDLIEKAKDDLSGEECPGGVIQDELDECLADIKKESCNNPLDSLTRLVSCRTGDMCRALP